MPRLTRPSPHRIIFPLLLTATILLLPSREADAAETIDPVIQIMADVTLIDAQCRTTNAAFDIVFNYAKDKDIAIVDILPLGKRRAEFDRAYHHRLSHVSQDDLCGPLRAEYERMFPGLFVAR